MKTTYPTKELALETAWRMTQESCIPVWVYERGRGWQVTGRGDLRLDVPVMPALPVLAMGTNTTPQFDNPHPDFTVYRVAWTDHGLTQMHQHVSQAAAAEALCRGAAIVVTKPRDYYLRSGEVVAALRPMLGENFLAVQDIGGRHYVLLAGKKQDVIDLAYDTVVLHSILSTPGTLFEGVEPHVNT